MDADFSSPVYRSPARLLSCFRAAVVLFVIVGLCGERPSVADESVVVQLRSGRVVSGDVDSRTDDSELWLRTVEPSIILTTALPWSDLKAVRVQTKTMTADAFRLKVKELASDAPAIPLRLPAELAGRSARRNHSPSVRSMEVVATLTNSANDRYAEGVELRVRTLTASGEAVPVDGVISVDILGRRIVSNDRLESRTGLGFWSGQAAVRESKTTIDNHAYLEVGRWNERLRKSDLTAEGWYVLRLPFINVHPEYDLDVMLDAQLDAKLSVLGQDVLYATSPIQLRKFSRLREDLQLYRGTRFFPEEYLNR